MAEPGQLSVNDRVLLHLSRFAADMPPEEYPPECTQAGIAAAVGISRTHVPRAVKGLIKDGLAEELTSRVRGHERRMNVYALTREGLRRADELWQETLGHVFHVLTDGNKVEMSGRDIEALAGKRRAIAAISQMRNGVVEIDRSRRPPERDLSNAPPLGDFYGRESELRTMDSFMSSDARMLVVLGSRGYGATALTRKFVESQDESDVLWMPLSSEVRSHELHSALVSFGKRIRKDISSPWDLLALDSALVIFDGYFTVSDEVVEFFSVLVESLKEAKVIVTAREETPAYNWFYQKKHVDSGLIEELRIRGLDPDSAKCLLGNDEIEKDAFRRIMMMTRGQPMTLKMLRERDEKGLRKNTLFTAEEIRYLLFLRDKSE
ncbi:MAG: hypothetical protein ACUVT7_04975 [Thermoplasmata archaeon]